jgi:hypothetical protein
MQIGHFPTEIIASEDHRKYPARNISPWFTWIVLSKNLNLGFSEIYFLVQFIDSYNWAVDDFKIGLRPLRKARVNI